jgi:hypothetical protein
MIVRQAVVHRRGGVGHLMRGKRVLRELLLSLLGLLRSDESGNKVYEASLYYDCFLVSSRGNNRVRTGLIVGAHFRRN